MAEQHFVFFLLEDHTHLTLACAIEPLRIANLISGKDLYRWSYASEDGRRSTASNGTVVEVAHAFTDVPAADRLFVVPGVRVEERITLPLLSGLRGARRCGIAIGALCSGAWVLAQAGYLDGMKAAIHWEFHDAFGERFPDVSLVRNVFVADEKHVTASGGTATADLMLHLIEQDHGQDLSLAVSDMMVYAGAREGSAEQRVSLQSRNGMRNAHLAKAIRRMRETVETPIQTAALAREIGISVRQLERLFGRFLNTTPKRYSVELRLDRARHLLLQTEMSVIEVALACGFENPSHFSRSYRARFGMSPRMQASRIA